MIVGVKESGFKLLAYLKQKAPSTISVKAIKRAIDKGRCSVNGKIERFSTHLLVKGDRVEIDLQEDRVLIGVPSILYEDEDLLICDKPSGRISENSFFNTFFPKYHNQLELVHRLDKETSGVIILAKNKKMRIAMETLFIKREVSKAYLAIVDKKVGEPSGTIENFLAKKSSYEGQSQWGSVPRGKGKIAITRWKVLQVGKEASLLLLEPLTGRTHQLRVHLSEWGHPILGDVQYGQHFVCSLRPNRQLLHACKILFKHPFTQQEISVTAPLPQDFLASSEQLGLEAKTMIYLKNL